MRYPADPGRVKSAKDGAARYLAKAENGQWWDLVLEIAKHADMHNRAKAQGLPQRAELNLQGEGSQQQLFSQVSLRGSAAGSACAHERATDPACGHWNSAQANCRSTEQTRLVYAEHDFQQS